MPASPAHVSNMPPSFHDVSGGQRERSGSDTSSPPGSPGSTTSYLALQRATQPTSHAIQRMVLQQGRAGSPADEEVIRPSGPFIESPPLPHTGEEPEYVKFRGILATGDHAKAGKFYKQHPEIRLGPLVSQCSIMHLVNLLPLLNLNRHHPGFDRQIHANMQCQILHHLLDQALRPEFVLQSPKVSDLPPALNSRKEVYRTLVLEILTDFITENRDIEVAKFLPGCKTYESTPADKERERAKKEAILLYMRPDHPLYDDLKYKDLGHTVDDDVV